MKLIVLWALAVFSSLSVFAQTLTNVPQSRLERLSKGANVCLWFRFAPQNPEHFKNYISADEAKLMREMGLTHVRLCIQPKEIMNFTNGTVKPEMAERIEKAMERFHQAGLLVVMDLHNEDRQAENSPEWRENFVRFWGEFSKRMSRFDPEMTIFEIVNEPVFANHEADWEVHNARLVSTIRAQAPNHTIMTSGATWGGIDGLLRFKPVSDKNVVYSFHCYDPFTFTHQGATWTSAAMKPIHDVPYPSSPEAVAPLLDGLTNNPDSKAIVADYGKQRWDKAKLASRFKQAIEWGRTNQAPLYCGEFGVFPQHSKPADRARWFQDFGQILKENGIGWAVWGWDEGFGLNRKKENGKIVVDATVAEALGLSLLQIE